MQWSCDRTGFPYLHLPEIGLAVAMLPITKVQFEYWLADPSGPGEEWYAELLAIDPRSSWRKIDPQLRERVYLTGITPEETTPFLRWLGPTYRLPANQEWRMADVAIDRQPLADLCDAVVNAPEVSPPARAIIQQFVEAYAGDYRRVLGFDAGILEWVLGFRNKAGGYGRPLPHYCHVLLNPRIHEPVQPIAAGRQRAFGFRPVRPLSSSGGPS